MHSNHPAPGQRGCLQASVFLKVCSPDRQHQWHLRASWKRRIPGPPQATESESASDQVRGRPGPTLRTHRLSHFLVPSLPPSHGWSADPCPGVQRGLGSGPGPARPLVGGGNLAKSFLLSGLCFPKRELGPAQRLNDAPRPNVKVSPRVHAAPTEPLPRRPEPPSSRRSQHRSPQWELPS